MGQTINSTSEKVATQANVRKARGIQMGSFARHLHVFELRTLTFETFDSVETYGTDYKALSSDEVVAHEKIQLQKINREE